MPLVKLSRACSEGNFTKLEPQNPILALALIQSFVIVYEF